MGWYEPCTWKGFERWNGLGFIVIDDDIAIVSMIFGNFCLNITFNNVFYYYQRKPIHFKFPKYSQTISTPNRLNLSGIKKLISIIAKIITRVNFYN